MSWTLILVQEKGYISKRLLAFMWILTAEPTPRTPVSARPLLLYQKVKSGRQNYKTGKHQHVSLYLQWGTSWPSPHTSDLAGSVVNTTKMGTTLFSSSDLQMSVTDQVILKKSFYLRKKKKNQTADTFSPPAEPERKRWAHIQKWKAELLHQGWLLRNSGITHKVTVPTKGLQSVVTVYLHSCFICCS